MPTASERARDEKDLWAQFAVRWDRTSVPDLWVDRPPAEKSVVLFHDPEADLDKRAKRWGYRLPDHDLSSLATYAAGLAEAEESGWASAQPDVATRAYEDRRFLLSDRIIHWAVPWLDTVGRCYPGHRAEAHADRDMLLALGDEARVAPALPGTEGIHAVGEDSFGPLEVPDSPEPIRSLWSGALILDATVRSLASATGYVEPSDEDLAFLFEASSARWKGLGTRHPGSAQLWFDLSARAARTAQRLNSS